MILVHLHKPVIIDELKKTVKNIKHMVPEQMIRDATGNIHKWKAYIVGPVNKLKATTFSIFWNT